MVKIVTINQTVSFHIHPDVDTLPSLALSVTSLRGRAAAGRPNADLLMSRSVRKQPVPRWAATLLTFNQDPKVRVGLKSTTWESIKIPRACLLVASQTRYAPQGVTQFQAICRPHGE
jgi:hypothetical protein